MLVLNKQSFRLVRDDIEIVNFDAVTAPAHLCAKYPIQYAEVFSKHSANLKALNMAEVLAPDHGLTFALRQGCLEAALYYNRSECDEGVCLFYKGVISMERVRGLVAPMIATTAFAENTRQGKDITGRAVALVLPCGKINVGSTKVFSRAGFFPTRFFKSKIDAQNIHRFVTAEPDGIHTRSMLMEATAHDLAEASARVLTDWDG